MTQDIQRYITLAQGVSAHAQAGTLAHETAVSFCKVILPALLVEIELAQRVDARLSQMFPAPAAPQPECAATVCSSRWAPPAGDTAGKAKKKRAKRATKKSKKTKEGKDVHAAS